MSAVLTRSCFFAAIVLIGILFRRANIMTRNDFHTISTIVMKITLPAAIISNFSGTEFPASLFSLVLLGTAVCLLQVLLQVFFHRGQSKSSQAFAVQNCTGYNIGTFALPFAQSFLGSAGVVAICLFDSGNSLLALGGSYGIAQNILSDSKGFDFSRAGKALIHSVPFLVYVAVVLLSLFHIQLPGLLVQFAGSVASANTFLSMLMIGVGFEFHASRENLKAAVKLLLIRYGSGLLLAVLFWMFLPFQAEYRLALVIACFAPLSAVGPAYTAELKLDHGFASALNSISIVISIIMISGALIILQ